MMRVVQGGPWHGSREGKKRITDHGYQNFISMKINKNRTLFFFAFTQGKAAKKDSLKRKAAYCKLHTFINLDRQR